jgi:hypothetical protein
VVDPINRGARQLVDLFGHNKSDTGRGNDLVVAGAGDDKFLFRTNDRGDDTVQGFGNGHDVVRLIGTTWTSFQDVLAAGEYTADGWRLQVDEDTSVTSYGIIEAQLVADDFALLL